MKNHFAVTVSDLSGSRHYTIKKSAKRNLIIALLLALSATIASFSYNYIQLVQVNALSGRNSQLDRELVQFDRQNSRLSQVIANQDALLSEEIVNQDLLVAEISQELVDIERASGVDTGDDGIPLAQRIRMIGQFYNEKEEEYSEIGNRVEQIEGMIGLENTPRTDNPHAEDPNTLATRVDVASLSASQEKILHDSIPNGYPTGSRVVTSKFGKRVHPVTKVKSFHKGVDLRAKDRIEVFATADGIVREANYSKLSGNRIIVQHNFGFDSRYAHLHKMNVEPGDIVHKGDLIGISGNSGQSIAPHLHYEIRYLGKSIDPSQFLEWEFGSHEIFTQVRGVKWPSLISLINKQITHQMLQLSQLDRNLTERLR